MKQENNLKIKMKYFETLTEYDPNLSFKERYKILANKNDLKPIYTVLFLYFISIIISIIFFNDLKKDGLFLMSFFLMIVGCILILIGFIVFLKTFVFKYQKFSKEQQKALDEYNENIANKYNDYIFIKKQSDNEFKIKHICDFIDNNEFKFLNNNEILIYLNDYVKYNEFNYSQFNQPDVVKSLVEDEIKKYRLPKDKIIDIVNNAILRRNLIKCKQKNEEIEYQQKLENNKQKLKEKIKFEKE